MVTWCSISVHWSLGKIILSEPFSYLLWSWLSAYTVIFYYILTYSADLPARREYADWVNKNTTILRFDFTGTSRSSNPSVFFFALLCSSSNLRVHEWFQNFGLPLASILHSLVAFLVIHRIQSPLWMNFNYISTCVCLGAQSCWTLCDPMDCSPPDSSVHGDSPGKDVAVGCHSLLPNQNCWILVENVSK